MDWLDAFTSAPDVEPGQDFLAGYFDENAANAAIETLNPTPDPYFDDPVGFVENGLGEFIWSGQKQILESVRDHRFTTVRSAHGTGKSRIASRCAGWWIRTRPVGQAFVVTSAPTEPQIGAILWREIRDMHRKAELPGRITLDNKWYIGHDQLVGYGRKPADYSDPSEAMQAFQGIHAKYVLVILDEGCGIPKWLFDATDSLVTNDHSRVLVIGNPDNPASEFYNTHKPGSGWNQLRISAYDLPCFTGEEVPEYLNDVLTGRTWVEERRKKWGKRSPLYISKVTAEFPEVASDALISPALIEKAHGLDFKTDESTPAVFGADVARFGEDETVVYENRGGKIRLQGRWHQCSTMESAGWFAEFIAKQPEGIPMTIDADGVGGGVYDRLVEQELPVGPFHGGTQALDAQRFYNRRSEIYWEARKMLEEGQVDLDPKDEELANELQQIRWTMTSTRKIKVEAKDDIKKRLGHSPDRADAFVYSLVRPEDWDAYLDEEAMDRAMPSLTGDLLNRIM